MKQFLFVFFLSVFSFPAQSAVLPIQEVVSAKGIKAWLVEDYSLPLISVQFSFRGGVETDLESKQGLSVLATHMLTQGAGPYDEKAFQEKLAASSIQMGFSAGRDYVQGQMKTLSRKKGAAFKLLRLALTAPRFDQSVFERMRQQQKASVKFQVSNPSWQGRYALYQDIFGKHPYGYRSLGSYKTLSTVQLSDMNSFARSHLVRDRLQVAVVGAMNAKELARILDQVFGPLPQTSSLKEVQPFNWPGEIRSLQVNRKGAQTNVFFVAPMMKREDPDWYAARIANYVLGGGGFISHLMREVRAQEGLTYGISTGLAPMDKASMLTGSMATDNDKTGQAVDLVRDVWGRFYEKGPTEAEVRAAQDYLTGAMALALTSTDSVASVLLSMLNQGLAIDYLDKRNAYFRKVTRDDVLRVISKWFNPDQASYVYVGAPKGVSPDKEQILVTE